MKPLETSFKSCGFEFKQLKRQGDVALFQKGKPTFDRAYSYEVVKVQKHKEREIAGVIIPAQEAMPSNEMWGQAGWTYYFIEAANKKFNSLV